MIAAVLGACLALWLLRGDTGAAEHVASCIVDHHDTWDAKEIQFFQINCGQANGAFTVSVDKDLPLARWLAQRHRQRVSLALGGRE